MAAEEPDFRTVRRDGAYEIRDYPALVVAEVTVPGDQKQAASRGFRLLAGYIFGGNHARAGIAMTAPVTQSQPSRTIPMTAPVTQRQTGNDWVVRFMMPRGATLATLPIPDNPNVHLLIQPPERVAVRRFAGLALPSDVAAKTAELTAWMTRQNLPQAGPPTLAQYNPPWTLWFLRRNEVMIPIGH